MTEFEHMMLVACFSCIVGTWIGAVLGLIIIFISGKFKAHRARKLSEKETLKLETNE